MISVPDLQQVCGSTRQQIAVNHPYITQTMEACEINTPLRLAMFLSQVIVETGGFRWLEEIADGSAYEGRADLGNIAPGDGKKFKGRGDIMLTGRSWYTKCSVSMFGDFTLIKYPELLAEPVHAAASAGWFWQQKNLNTLADAGDAVAVSKKVNGGVNGLPDRLMFFKRACTVLGVQT